MSKASDKAALKAATAAELAKQAFGLVTELLPGASPIGDFLCAGGYDGGAGLGLVIRVQGRDAGAWRRIAATGSTDWGDLVDLIGKVNQCDRDKAVRWARGWLGYSEKTGRKCQKRQPVDGVLPGRAAARIGAGRVHDGKAHRAATIVRCSVAAAHTPAEAWVRALGYDAPEAMTDIRFVPDLELPGHDGVIAPRAPAIIGVLSTNTGKFAGVWRHWITLPDGPVLRHDVLKRGDAARIGPAPAGLEHNDLALGHVTGAAITVQTGPSGVLHVTRRVETAIMLAARVPGDTVLATLTPANMAHVYRPKAATLVLYHGAHDADNVRAAAVLQRQFVEAMGIGPAVEVRRLPAFRSAPAAVDTGPPPGHPARFELEEVDP